MSMASSGMIDMIPLHPEYSSLTAIRRHSIPLRYYSSLSLPLWLDRVDGIDGVMDPRSVRGMTLLKTLQAGSAAGVHDADGGSIQTSYRRRV